VTPSLFGTELEEAGGAPIALSALEFDVQKKKKVEQISI